MTVAFHFDPACPWTWITSRWLVDAADIEGFEVEWVPISLDHLNGDDEHRIGVLAGRVVQHLREVEGNEAAGRFYEAWGRRFHEHGEAAEVRTVIDTAAPFGVEAQVVDDEHYDAPIAHATDAASRAAGGSVGSPILRWDDVAIFGPILTARPKSPVELWRLVRATAEVPQFSELKRGRPDRPKNAGGGPASGTASTR